jgi:BCCT family betaine/carnitine transporter
MGFGVYLAGVGDAFVDYARTILPLSDWRDRADADWYHGWTVFYWAWWCSWGPLVGVFVARVSRGRTLRQMVAVVMVTPAVFTLLWFGAFGRGAIDQVAAGRGPLAGGLQDVNMAIFQYLGSLPLAGVTSVLVIILLVIFTVTSVDSGALVADNMAANGRTDTKPLQRVLWVFMIGLVATTLMVLGGEAGLKALQSFTIVAALPFLVLMLVLLAGLVKALAGELRSR